MQYIYPYHSPFGRMTLASDGEVLTGAWFDGQKYFASTLSQTYKERELPLFRQCKAWLDTYFNGEKPEVLPVIRPEGSPFRLAVWDILKQIPYGQVITYGEIAKKITRQTGKARMSAQAVGGAVGHNPVSLFIPCHRVVGSNGSLTGYAGGILIKEKLLLLEGADMTPFFIHK